MKEGKSVPEIRFKGFTGEWEEIKLGDVSSYKTSSLCISDAEKRGSFDLYDANSIIGRTNKHKMSQPYITIIKDGSGVGKIRKLPQDTFFIGTMGAIVSSKNTDLSYLYYNLCSFDFSKYIKGATIPHVYYSDFSEEKILLPSLEEQHLLGSFFSSLDDLIHNKEIEVDKLKKIKLTLLDKMFPKEGEKVPEIRFKGFTGEWEEVKLGDVTERYDNQRIPVAENLRKKGYTSYYGANGIQDYVEGYTHDGEFVLVAEDGASDLKNYPIFYIDNKKIWVNNHTHVLQGKNKILDNRFLTYFLKIYDFSSIIVGGGRSKLNASTLILLRIFLPSLEEQRLLGSFFSSLDDLIHNKEIEVDKLKKIKLTLLDKMFV